MTNQKINCVGVVVKPNHAEAWATACGVAAWLKTRGIGTVSQSRPMSEMSDIKIVDVERFERDVDLIVVLGGDGTMISTARLTGAREIPVLGINYGSLGYLTEFRIEEVFTALEAILEGNFDIDCRLMLDVEHLRNGETLAVGRVLNEVVINKAAIARIIEIEVEWSGLSVNSFRADGLIISTPTGSTAYNLSAGGPIVFPSMNAVVITPICPFTLTNRPIVVPDDAPIKIRLKNDIEGVVLTLDGQIGHQIQAKDTVVIRKSSTNFNLIQPPNRNYFDVLRNKLKWGR